MYISIISEVSSMNNGNRRRGRKKYKVRYDRIIAVVLVFIVLIVIISSCTKSCSKKDDGKKKPAAQTSVVDQLTSNQPATDQNGSTEATGAPVQDPYAETEYTVQNFEASAVNSGDLVLVNSLHEYTAAEGDIDPVTIYDHKESGYGVSDYVVSLDSDTLTKLNEWMTGFNTTQSNNDLSIISGYRTKEEQNDKYQNGTSKFQGGFSDYNTGRTVDIGIFPQSGSSNYYAPDGVYAWLDENAANYGFIQRFPADKEGSTGENGRTYTYRYVGVPHATYIKQNGLCLEEYIETVKTYSNTSPLSVNVNEKKYNVYYVKANTSGSTEVLVPTNKNYTVSGNNVDGFVVAVEMS